MRRMKIVRPGREGYLMVVWVFFFKNCDGSLYLGLEEVVGSFVHSSSVSPKKNKNKKRRRNLLR